MPTFFDNSASGVMDQLLEQIRTQADEVRLIDGYSQGDSWADVNTATVSTVSISTANFDTPGDAGTLARRLNFTGANDLSSAGGTGPTPDLHIALVRAASTTVLAVTNETSDQPITAGNPITYPSFYLQVSQPGQA